VTIGGGCAKQRYVTRKEAKRALGHWKRRPESSVRRVYRCPYCDTYHLTSQHKRKAQRERMDVKRKRERAHARTGAMLRRCQG
jgi:hypothetical protein